MTNYGSNQYVDISVNVHDRHDSSDHGTTYLHNKSIAESEGKKPAVGVGLGYVKS